MDRKHNSRLVPVARSLRKGMTKEERHLWYDYLRKYPVHFYRQRVIGNYIVDFYCAQARLVIELDGSQHYEDYGVAYDEKRTEFLQSYGLQVIRIPNNEVNRNFSGVCEHIDRIVNEAMKVSSV